MPSIESVKAATLSLDALMKASDDNMEDPFRMLIYGPSRVGKSFLAATASKFWPEDIKERIKGNVKSKVVLEDVCWNSFDDGATDLFRPMGISIPRVISFSAVLEHCEGDARKAISKVIELNKKAKENGAEILVNDTISQLDGMLQVSIKRDENITDNQALFGTLFIEHKRISASFRALNMSLLYLTHAKALIERKTEDAKVIKERKAEKAAKYSDVPEVEPEITGKGASCYKHNVSLTGVLLKKGVREGNKISQERRLFVRSKDGFEAGSRFEALFAKLDPNNEGLEPDLGPILKALGYR